MWNQGVRHGWTYTTNVQAIKHVQLTYEQVNAMYNSFT